MKKSEVKALKAFSETCKIVNDVLRASEKKTKANKARLSSIVKIPPSKLGFVDLPYFKEEIVYLLNHFSKLGKSLGRKLFYEWDKTIKIYPSNGSEDINGEYLFSIIVFYKNCYLGELDTGEHKGHNLRIYYNIENDIAPIIKEIKSMTTTKGMVFEISEYDFQKVNVEGIKRKDVQFSDILEQEFDSLVKMFTKFNMFKEKNIPFERHILLHGKPGVGKTSFVTALCNEIKDLATCVITNEGIERAFEFATTHLPALVVIEDFDLIAKDRDYRETSSKLLNVLNGSVKYDGIVVIATTNKISVLDPAAIRSGRMNSIYEMKPPSKKEREIILNKIAHRYSVDPKSIRSQLKENMTGADINDLVINAKQNEIIKGKRTNTKELPSNSKIGF